MQRAGLSVRSLRDPIGRALTEAANVHDGRTVEEAGGDGVGRRFGRPSGPSAPSSGRGSRVRPRRGVAGWRAPCGEHVSGSLFVK